MLEDCHFQIQLSVHPATIHFATPPKKMLGAYTNELKESISFDGKDDFLEKATKFNTIRNNVIHKMRKSNLDEISNSLCEAKQLFDEIYDLYDKIQDDFRVTFHGFQKNVFLDEYGDDDDFDL